MRHQDRASSLMTARRPAAIAFVVGFLVTVPAAFLSLLFTWAEALASVVVPGAFLLRPLSPAMANWHGAVNMGLLSVANGLVFGLIVFAIAAGRSAWRARKRLT